LHSLRTWWRLLDVVENKKSELSEKIFRVDDVRNITELHRHAAFQANIGAHAFGYFIRVANLTGFDLNAPQLHWPTPRRAPKSRTLSPEKELRIIRSAIKAEWLKTYFRWTKAEQLLTGQLIATTPEEKDLLAHYEYYVDVQKRYGKALLSAPEIANGLGPTSFTSRTGLATLTMKDGFFPNRWDIDSAFHQCLSVTGWNACTLFSLDATQPFLITHPRNDSMFALSPADDEPESYELTGIKERARGAEQRIFGLWKTKFGAGKILLTLLERTQPLREQLNADYLIAKNNYAQLHSEKAPPEEILASYKNVLRLEAGCRSVWLYYDTSVICWLGKSVNNSRPYNVNGRQTAYLAALIGKLNNERPAHENLSVILPSDLRDAFTLWVYRATGGNILAVMRALQHRWLRSTSIYLKNNILNNECNDNFRDFSNLVFDELNKGRLDVTILAHRSRYGNITIEQERKLEEYRKLQLSRCGVACKDPKNPPKSIAPTFVPNGQRMCPSQRCLLCKENAVLLPESIDGLCMRAEELTNIQTAIPISSWLQSQFQEELDNILSALSLYDEQAVRQSRSKWAEAISTGSHRIPGLPISA
jgi:hypothetical protein